MKKECCPNTSFKGKEEFTKLKKKDIIVTFDKKKYFIINDLLCMCIYSKRILHVYRICLDIHYVLRDGTRIANRRYWKRDLLISRKKRYEINVNKK